VQGSVIRVSKERCNAHQGVVRGVDRRLRLPCCYFNCKSDCRGVIVTAKLYCRQSKVSTLTAQCLTVVWKLFQDRAGLNRLQEMSHNELQLRLRNCDYDTKSSTDTVRNNEHKTAMHKTRCSGIRQTARQTRGKSSGLWVTKK
jgi:hypothetical protein